MSRFFLEAGEAAIYAWGSCYIDFSGTPFGHDIQKAVLATVLQQNAQWDSEGDFRATVAFLHELTHYLQDVTTGVGHQDFVTRVALTADLAAHPDGGRPRPAVGEALLQRLVFVPNAWWPPRRTDRFWQQTSSLVRREDGGGTAHPPYTPENLLETEAISYVFLQIRNVKCSDRQRQIAFDQDYLFLPGKLKKSYQLVLEDFLGVMVHVTGEDLPRRIHEETDGKTMEVVLGWLLFFIDLCLAYPSDDSVDAGKNDGVHYEPGVKFARLMTTFAAFDERTHEALSDAFYKSDFDSAETLLLDACAFRYPHSREIYRSWEQRLATTVDALAPDDRRQASIRLSACRNRVADGTGRRSMYKTLAAAATPRNQILPPILSSSGMTYLVVNEEHLSTGEQRDAGREAMWLNGIQRSLEDSVVFGEPFLCPILRHCDVRTSQCDRGHHTLATLPAEGCSARLVSTRNQIQL